MTHLLVATRNAHKVGEMAAILGPGFTCHTLAGFPGAPGVVEDAPDFAGNALKKAATLAGWLQAAGVGPRDGAQLDFVLADDSGLEVDALQGAPGVHSARFAALDDPGAAPGVNASDAANNAKLLRLLEGVPLAGRRARFRCVLALVPLGGVAGAAGPGRKTFSGTCEGHIALAPAGVGGFGYDPLFVPDGHAVSFAELGESVKNRLSHRARALAALLAHFADSSTR
ncbi:MAG: hypothetical protein RJA22_2213 [Verrucomicrobiota bacterium]|jgi:XTP/dITP diphosphohydrolase